MRYAYITFKTKETCLKMLNNEIQGCVNETVLHWVYANVKTCYKCGSMEYLIFECQEKKDNNKFKQRRNSYNKVGSARIRSDRHFGDPIWT